MLWNKAVNKNTGKGLYQKEPPKQTKNPQNFTTSDIFQGDMHMFTLMFWSCVIRALQKIRQIMLLES